MMQPLQQPFSAPTDSRQVRCPRAHSRRPIAIGVIGTVLVTSIILLSARLSLLPASPSETQTSGTQATGTTQSQEQRPTESTGSTPPPTPEPVPAGPAKTVPAVEVAPPPASASGADWVERYLWTPVSGLILGVIVTVIGTILYDRLKRRVRIQVLHRNRRRVVDEIQSLYMERIDPSERVSPKYVTDCLNHPEICIRSAREFLSRARMPGALPPVLHLLVAARCQGEVVGFVKAIYVSTTRMLFIAYSASQGGEGTLERRAMRRLLGYLREVVTPTGPVDWITFEIMNSNKPAAMAKERLFRQYAHTFGLALQRVDIEYLQPDLDCVELDQCREESAFLYLGSRVGSMRAIDAATLRRLVESIFLDIYLPTWLIDRSPPEGPGLEEYVRGLADLILDRAPSRIALL